MRQNPRSGGPVLALSGGKVMCHACRHPVQMVTLDGESIAVEPEIIKAISYPGRSGGQASILAARRVHAELCDKYKSADEKAKLRAEMVEYNNQRRGL